MDFNGRLFAGRLFAGRLFGRTRQQEATGGIDWRYFWHSPKARRLIEDLPEPLAEQAQEQPPQAVVAVAQMADKAIKPRARSYVAEEIRSAGIDPTPVLIELYIEFVALRLRREEEAAIAACVAALV